MDPPTAVADGEAGIVLLNDGGVLEGFVRRADDGYVVARSGSQLQVASSRVLFIGRTLHDAYEFRRQQAVQPTADTHLALAEWCLRHSLADDAARELDAAREKGASGAKHALLERRLAATRYRLAQATAEPSTEHEKARVEVNQQGVQPAMSSELPDGVVEIFTRRVQPILVNNCTVSKCHSPGGEQVYQLNRALLRGESNRRTTMQNLAATLALVERARPETSPLLTIPRQSHGGMSGPVFGPRNQAAFKHLAEWVALVAPPAPPPPRPPSNDSGVSFAAGDSQTTAPQAEPRKLQELTESPIFAPTPANRNESRLHDRALPQEVEQVVAKEFTRPDSLQTPRRVQRGVSAVKWQPRDPFDPEIFNRRQSAMKKQ